jgi:hypothetical protein
MGAPAAGSTCFGVEFCDNHRNRLIVKKWRGGRAVECTGLENRHPLTGIASSNLALSAKHRWGRRKPINLMVRFFAMSGMTGVGRLLNISSSGAFLATTAPLRRLSLDP